MSHQRNVMDMTHIVQTKNKVSFVTEQPCTGSAFLHFFWRG